MIAAEKLLRIALFSDELPIIPKASLTDRRFSNELPKTVESTTGLTERRKELAGTIRAFRKKGIIPVFVSTLWFLLALAISIQSSFGNRGTNQAAHNLAVRTVRSDSSCLGLKSESQEEQKGPHTPQTCFATQVPGLKKQC